MRTKQALLAALVVLCIFIGGARFPGDSSAPAAVTERQEFQTMQFIPEQVQAPTGPAEPFTAIACPLPESVQREIYTMCEAAGVPFPVLMAIAEHESGYNPKAVSKTGDHGLCQINGRYAPALMLATGATDLYDPIQNAKIALYILGPLWAKYPPSKALMAYGYGETGAARKWDAGQVTCRFSREMLELAEIYGWEGTV